MQKLINGDITAKRRNQKVKGLRELYLERNERDEGIEHLLKYTKKEERSLLSNFKVLPSTENLEKLL